MYLRLITKRVSEGLAESQVDRVPQSSVEIPTVRDLLGDNVTECDRLFVFAPDWPDQTNANVILSGSPTLLSRNSRSVPED